MRRSVNPFWVHRPNAFDRGAEGLFAGATMLYEAWSCEMTTVTRPAPSCQGRDDKLIPEPINRTVVDRSPGAIWPSISGGGHLLALSHANEMLAQVASDLLTAQTLDHTTDGHSLPRHSLAGVTVTGHSRH